MEHRIINPWKWQDQFAFVQAHEISGGQRVLYCAGQTSVDGEGKPAHQDDMRGQINRAVDNLEAVLAAAGFNLSNVVRLNYYTTNVDQLLANWDAVVTRLGQAGCRPSSTLLGVTRLAFPELLIEIEATAVM
jgi:enamine deaminase RidA (YjgF/YER057c/UK114 family)